MVCQCGSSRSCVIQAQKENDLNTHVCMDQKVKYRVASTKDTCLKISYICYELFVYVHIFMSEYRYD